MMRHWLVVIAALALLTWPAKAQNSGTNNRTITDCSGAITTGGTAQTVINAGPGIGGFYIVNIDTTEPMWFNINGVAAPATSGSSPLAAGATTTFAGAGTFYSAIGYNATVSVVAATTGHKFTCKRW